MYTLVHLRGWFIIIDADKITLWREMMRIQMMMVKIITTNITGIILFVPLHLCIFFLLVLLA